jgi:Xaa-Pro dipeptidase
MTENRIDAIVLTGSTSLLYFTGVRWGLSERLFCLVLPAKGEPFSVCPAFENDRAHEQLALGPLANAEVRTWQETESPFDLVAAGLRDRGAQDASASRAALLRRHIASPPAIRRQRHLSRRGAG